MIRSLFPKLRIVARDNVVRVLGDDNDITVFQDKIELMRKHVLKFNSISEEDILDIIKGRQTKGEANEEVMKRARRGTIAAGYFKLFPVFMFLIPGMIAAALAQDPESGFSFSMKAGTNIPDTDAAFAQMVKFILPAGVKGIVTIGFICARVASLAAFFNSCATLCTEDF